ncbi:putative quinol monooxygenase [Sphingobium mellinum]|uniref:putative quinol monooxygenase n=1 Tax=Sphingobium mellinum TaxID=1387166 RepID=UPI0030EC9F7B
MKEPVTITVDYKLKPEFVEAFCEVIPGVLPDTAKFAGFRDIKVVRHSSDRDRVLIVETWDDEESYRKYIAWRTERGDVSRLDAMLIYAKTDVWPEVVGRA